MNPLSLKVTIHDPCQLTRGVDEWRIPRRILESIPGVEIVEMKRTREESPCCGGSIPPHLADVAKAMRHERLREAVSTGASVLTTTCPECDHTLSIDAGDFPITVLNILSLLTESAGSKQYENKLQRYRSYGDVDRVLNECADTIIQNGYRPEALRKYLARYLFGVPLDVEARTDD